MKKLVILILVSLSLISCGEKFPYTSKNEKIKLLKEYEELANKVEQSGDEKDMDKVFEKLGEITKITKELEKEVGMEMKKHQKR